MRRAPLRAPNAEVGDRPNVPLRPRHSFQRRRMSTRHAVLALALALAAAAAIPVSAQNLQIDGAGATFPNPIYSKWFSEYNKLHPNVQINYQSIGSGGGIRQLSAETVFFGATDGPMTNDQIFAAPG